MLFMGRMAREKRNMNEKKFWHIGSVFSYLCYLFHGRLWPVVLADCCGFSRLAKTPRIDKAVI